MTEAKKVRLNQIIAVETATKPRIYEEVGKLDKVLQKPDLFNGFTKTYRPLDDAGEKYPAEAKRVQFSAFGTLQTIATLTSELFAIVARKDWTNTEAKATVVLDDGMIVVENAPVSYLLFLEKQLTDFRTIISRVPVLDEALEWTYDANAGNWKSGVQMTHRTKKEQRAIVLYEATDKHPAQAQLITEDRLVGFWDMVNVSGAMPRTKRDDILAKIETVLKAVKTAREEANLHEEVVTPKSVGETIFGYLLGDK